MKFTVFLLQVASGNLFELSYKSLNYVEELNNGSQATFQFDYKTIKDDVATPYSTNVKDLFTAVFTEMWIQDESGTKIWYGVVSEYNRTKDTAGNYTLQIAAVDYFSLLQKRRTEVDKIYTAVDPATIPWDLININQTSGLPKADLGITVGTTVSTGLSVSAEYKRADIKQSISDLSNYKVQGSFDFDIDYTKKFNMYYPTKGSLRANVVLDDNNIQADSVKIPLLLAMTNNVFVRGQGINNDVAESNRTASTPTINEYTLLEDVISDTQVSDTTVLAAEGDKFLALNQLPLYAVSLRHDDAVDITTYGLGDTIIANITEEQISYAQYRVKKRTVDISDTNAISVQVDLLTI
jgi:hypothetical protein